jgi:mono/diheme cytochrome c family protein
MTAMISGGSPRRGVSSPVLTMRPLKRLLRLSVLVCGLAASLGSFSQNEAAAGEFYEIIDGKVDTRTYNGFRRYHAGCNHCHGPDGVGSTFASALVDRLPDIETFRRVVREGQSTGVSVMKGFAEDPNFAPYVDDIYAYLKARADAALGRGRPTRLEPQHPLDGR